MKYTSKLKVAFIPTTRHLLIALALVFFTQGCGKGGDPIKLPETVIPDNVSGTFNLDKLTAWKGYQANKATPYNLAIFGDSYVQGDYFTYLLRGKLLTDGNLDGGPGYCSFGRFGSDLSTIDSSIDPTELTFTYDPLQWTVNQENTVGPCGDVISKVNNSVINVTSNVPLDEVTIIYEQHQNAGDFRFRLNDGPWKTVTSAAAVEAINTYKINTSSAGSKFTLDIESLTTGQRFCGVVGKRIGNVLTIDKAGMSGGIAVFFGQDYTWQASVEALAPNGAIIMFGTNEQKLNIDPENLSVNVQYMIDHLREHNPLCDIILMCPPETTYETEVAHKYKLAEYGAALKKLAVSNHAAYINFEEIFPPFAQSSIEQGLMNIDRVHPGAKGGELIAQTIFNALTK